MRDETAQDENVTQLLTDPTSGGGSDGQLVARDDGNGAPWLRRRQRQRQRLE